MRGGGVAAGGGALGFTEAGASARAADGGDGLSAVGAGFGSGSSFASGRALTGGGAGAEGCAGAGAEAAPSSGGGSVGADRSHQISPLLSRTAPTATAASRRTDA
jgi:hypothetical protein